MGKYTEGDRHAQRGTKDPDYGDIVSNPQHGDSVRLPNNAGAPPGLGWTHTATGDNTSLWVYNSTPQMLFDTILGRATVNLYDFEPEKAEEFTPRPDDNLLEFIDFATQQIGNPHSTLRLITDRKASMGLFEEGVAEPLRRSWDRTKRDILEAYSAGPSGSRQGAGFSGAANAAIAKAGAEVASTEAQARLAYEQSALDRALTGIDLSRGLAAVVDQRPYEKFGIEANLQYWNQTNAHRIAKAQTEASGAAAAANAALTGNAAVQDTAYRIQALDAIESSKGDFAWGTTIGTILGGIASIWLGPGAIAAGAAIGTGVDQAAGNYDPSSVGYTGSANNAAAFGAGMGMISTSGLWDQQQKDFKNWLTKWRTTQDPASHTWTPQHGATLEAGEDEWYRTFFDKDTQDPERLKQNEMSSRTHPFATPSSGGSANYNTAFDAYAYG